MITLTEQIALIRRELRSMEVNYPHLVASGKKRQSHAEDDIAAMRAALETLEAVASKPFQMVG